MSLPASRACLPAAPACLPRLPSRLPPACLSAGPPAHPAPDQSPTLHRSGRLKVVVVEEPRVWGRIHCCAALCNVHPPVTS